jgi:hypothetical protein
MILDKCPYFAFFFTFVTPDLDYLASSCIKLLEFLFAGFFTETIITFVGLVSSYA